MELRHLRYFVTVAEELNMTRAAARLKLSQPPLSRQIRDLEAAVGALLFDRKAKKLKLTAAGQYFFKEAKNILLHAQRAARIARATAQGGAGSVKVGFLSPLGGTFLPQVMRAFRPRFPLVEVDLFELVPRSQIDALLNHEIDLGFVAKEEVQSINELAFAIISDVPLQLAVPSDHRFVRESRVRASELSKESFIMFTRSSAPATRDMLLRTLRSAGIEPSIVKQCDRAQMILDFVAAGIGIAILPGNFRRYRAQVTWRAMIPSPPAIELCMAWRATDQSAPLRALRSLTLAHFKRSHAG
ncbi:LysR family transcriptional regulator [Acidobacteria bacterium AB60]|nr:LysR family transcriptional regulator [Acidobacteria bacterium AB60]